MKKSEIKEIKNLEIKELLARVKKVRGELIDFSMDKNMKKSKDLKFYFKKRKEMARILTFMRQKELLEQLKGVSK
ncbi:MAG: Uncharacterized protein G01um101493_41 [Microgenomates group bacterium Gr01-1014_93]|nr:MAG: Uncharacterized protein G01um101493_41 [Microgenomates group bacterium Gr01-1014_93]